MTRIGFIGLGNMGGPMAANLARAGHAVRVFDLMPESVAKAIAAGCIAAGDAREAVTGCDLAISMLPAGEHVSALLPVQGSTSTSTSTSRQYLLSLLSLRTIAASACPGATVYHLFKFKTGMKNDNKKQ